MLFRSQFERKNFLNAFGSLFAFGFAVGAILGTTRGMWKWGWRSAVGAWVLVIITTIISLIVRRAKGLHLEHGQAG